MGSLSLLSPSILRLAIATSDEVAERTNQIPASCPDSCLPSPGAYVDVLVRRRSVYIIRGVTRYRMTHAILSNDMEVQGQGVIHRDRRISLMCRSRPEIALL